MPYTPYNVPSPVESQARGQQQGYARRLSELRAEGQQQQLRQQQRNDVAQAAQWVMSQPKEMQEQSFNQALDFYAAQGEDVEAFRGRLDLLPMMAQGGERDRRPAGLVQFESISSGLSPEDQEKAKRIKLGLDPRAMAASKKTIDVGGVKYSYDPVTDQLSELTVAGETVTPETVAESEAMIAGKTAEERAIGKARGEFATSGLMADMKSKIVSAQEKAKATAKGTGETESNYIKLKSSMPALREVIGELSDLAQVATYTKAGRALDTFARELGLDPGEGATASAKYGAIVSNQVLPILKATLGAAFTATEYEKMEGTMGDQSLSPAEKQEQLDAFIRQKELQLETMEREIGVTPIDQPIAPSAASASDRLKALEAELLGQ